MRITYPNIHHSECYDLVNLGWLVSDGTQSDKVSPHEVIIRRSWVSTMGDIGRFAGLGFCDAARTWFDHVAEGVGDLSDRVADAFDMGPRLEFAGVGDVGRLTRDADRGTERGSLTLMSSDREFQKARRKFAEEHGGRLPTSEELAQAGFKRPYLRKGTREAIDEVTDDQGRLIDPNTRKVIKGKPDIGHKPGYEWRDFEKEAKSKGLSQEQVNALAQNPKAYRLEDPGANRSHKFEGSQGQSDWLKGVTRHRDGSISSNGLRITKEGRVYDETTGDLVGKKDVANSWKGKTPSRAQRAATDAQIKADRLAAEARGKWFGKDAALKKAAEAQRAADEAASKAKKRSWW